MKAEARAQLKHLRISPQKTRLVIDLIRGMKLVDALVQLQFSRKHAARPIKKLLESATANAKNNHNLKEETLVIKTAFADEGSVLHRWMPRAMGRATPLRKRSSHITIVLEGEVDEKKVKKSAKTETKVGDKIKSEGEEAKSQSDVKYGLPIETLEKSDKQPAKKDNKRVEKKVKDKVKSQKEEK